MKEEKRKGKDVKVELGRVRINAEWRKWEEIEGKEEDRGEGENKEKILDKPRRGKKGNK